VGVPVADTDIKIVDLQTGKKELPAGESGEIIIRGPQVMMGYYRKPEQTAEVIRDGWFYTGDIGHFDEDGYLLVTDRIKDMIISGGYNIYPVEVDNILMDHSKILEACSIGIPDTYRGESVKSYVVLKSGEEIDAVQIIAFCRERLAPYKVPREIEFVKELPKSAVGKILRREVRELERRKREGVA